jgi:hypothetical protein
MDEENKFIRASICFDDIEPELPEPLRLKYWAWDAECLRLQIRAGTKWGPNLNCGGYPVDFVRDDQTPFSLMGWINHISEKTWARANPEILGEFALAISVLFDHYGADPRCLKPSKISPSRLVHEPNEVW